MATQVTVFSDYICPFCYVGSRRLLRVADELGAEVLWANIEIHPETPPEGMPVEDLGYDPEQWRRMMTALDEMARAEGLPVAERTFTTNSRRALLMAEAAKDEGPDVFAAVHEALFRAFFGEGRNIGDAEVLCAIAETNGLPEWRVDRAWTDPAYGERLQQYQATAARLGVRGTPTFIIGERALVGAVETDELRRAIQQAS